MMPDNDTGLESLLQFLKRTRGFDFLGYKRSTLSRRVDKRMHMVGIPTYNDYVDYLEVHPEEFSQLFNTILINVTSFLRDEAEWTYLRQTIIPQILAHRQPDDPVRVWCAGCASGEEAYSLAILLAQAMGDADFRRRVKIFATDVDEDALAQARAATYAGKDLEAIPPDLRQSYFEPAGSSFTFRADLRRSIIFGRHDLVQDAPMSRLDLLSCRNTIMYFNAETQGRILARFHFALNDDGFLFLGKAEMLLTHADIFSPSEIKHHIFSKLPRPPSRDRPLALAQAKDAETANHLGRHVRLRELAFDAGNLPQMIIDINGILVLANTRARNLFMLTPIDIGRPLQDLDLTHRLPALRSLLEQAYLERRAATLNNVESRLPNGDLQYLDIHATRLDDNGGARLGVNIAFEDVTREQQLQQDLQRTATDLETAYEELQSAHEELETTNEELQSTNEELETTNEELQSSNEELQTMNEELQSTNEELQTLNTELRERTDESRKAADFLQVMLGAIPAGVMAVDSQFRILIWNHVAEDVWGLRADEVIGQSILGLEIGLPVDQLPLAAVLAGKTGKQDVTIVATNRRGKTITVQVSCREFLGGDGQREGVLLLIEEAHA